MSYDYHTQKPFVFTDEGTRAFLKIRDVALKSIEFSGAVCAEKLLHAAGAGDTWDKMACIDRLVEIGDLRLVSDPEKGAWQHRVYVKGRE